MENLGSLPIILLFGLIFYVLMIRPQQKRQREAQEMLKQITVGDEVVTVGGIHGEVVDTDDETVDLLVNADTVIRFNRSSIGRVSTAETLDDDESEDDDAEDQPVESAAEETSATTESWPDATSSPDDRTS